MTNTEVLKWAVSTYRADHNGALPASQDELIRYLTHLLQQQTQQEETV